MVQNIGVISPKKPISALPLSKAPKNSRVLWFNEVEAAFAFLLNNILDRLYVDRELMDSSYIYTRKYLKQIEQLHPGLLIGPINLLSSASRENRINPFYVPKINTLFKNGEIKSVFQPIVKVLGDHKIIHGLECLSRFYFGGQKLLPEFVFNYANEKLKLINCDKICLMQALSLVPHDKDTLIFVNVRPQTLIASDFSNWFKMLLKKNQLCPEQIVIEITEQYCNISEKEMAYQCKALKSFGIRFAIDDFGSGISNLSMLQIMKPNYIKISGRFIKDCYKDLDKQKIIKNILDLSAEFQIATIVESVENEQDWQQVRLLGAFLAQGFYFFKPMETEELTDVLNNQGIPVITMDYLP